MQIQINWIIQAGSYEQEAYPKHKLTWSWPRIYERWKNWGKQWIRGLLCRLNQVPAMLKSVQMVASFKPQAEHVLEEYLGVRNYNGDLIMALSLSL